MDRRSFLKLGAALPAVLPFWGIKSPKANKYILRYCQEPKDATMAVAQFGNYRRMMFFSDFRPSLDKAQWKVATAASSDSCEIRAKVNRRAKVIGVSIWGIPIKMFEIAAYPTWKRGSVNPKVAVSRGIVHVEQHFATAKDHLESCFVKHFGISPHKCVVHHKAWDELIPADKDCSTEGVIVYRNVAIVMLA